MLLPVKSRIPKRKLMTTKNAHNDGVGKSFSRMTARRCDSAGPGSSCARHTNSAAIKIPSAPNSNTGARQPAVSARQPA